MKTIVLNLMRAALMECCHPGVVRHVIRQRLFAEACDLAVSDLAAFAKKDPAAHGREDDIAFGYPSYKAVLHYRLAHIFFKLEKSEKFHGREFENAALLISSRGKILSGAEIHPRSRIGQRFVLDHGFGTVIGETTNIGEDCYILGGVTLGAMGISKNPQGKRHPTIGNRVEIGAFARIFGDVVIGDDVFIASHCVVTQDIPCGAMVTLKSEIQITKRNTRIHISAIS